jgi:hypothetical protein
VLHTHGADFAHIDVVIRQLDWSGGVLAGIWIDLLLLHNESAGNTCNDDDEML